MNFLNSIKRKLLRILKEKRELHITFINPNTEEQIVQAMAGVLAYNLAEENEKIKFDYRNIEQDYEMEI